MEAAEAAEQVAIRLKDLPRRVLVPKVPALRGKAVAAEPKDQAVKEDEVTQELLA